MPFEFFIGWRYMKAKRQQALISLISWISLLGVALGVAALTVVLAVMSGSQEELRRKVMGVNAHVIVLRYGGPLEDYREGMQKVGELDGVVSVEPFIYHQVMLSAKGGVSGGTLRGIDPELVLRHGHFNEMLRDGSLMDLKGPENRPEGYVPGIILGTELAKTLGVQVGDGVRVISPAGSKNKYGGRSPKAAVYRVVGLMSSGLYEYDSTLAYLDLKDAQHFLNLEDGVTGLEIRVKDIYRADATRDQVLEVLGPGYWARDWMQMNRNIFAALKLQKTVLFIILSLTVLVAAFNIVSSLTMVVMEKTRDIAILKSMGAGRWSIMKIFLFQGLTLGLSGTLAGLTVGLAICELLVHFNFIDLPVDVYFFDRLPVRLQAFDLLLVSGAAVLISLLATLYPAWQASRLNPAEALRYE